MMYGFNKIMNVVYIVISEIKYDMHKKVRE